MSYQLYHGFSDYKDAMSDIARLLELPDKFIFNGTTLEKYYVDTLRPKDFKYASLFSDRDVELKVRGKSECGEVIFASVSCVVGSCGGSKFWITTYHNKHVLENLLTEDNNGN